METQIKDIIQDLFKVMVVTSHYDTSGRPSKEENPLFLPQNTQLDRHRPDPHPPLRTPELVKYVEGGRNPDIYTREFVELVRRGNQLTRGKMHAFSTFRDILAEQMAAAMPELKNDVDRVVEETRLDSSAGEPRPRRALGLGLGLGHGDKVRARWIWMMEVLVWT
ncbi:unnamed protein product [Parascedosporium putredinis]|uniref:Mediator of RNA polymerase II transcription subunit 10 n=1 Tax=Parascedosporium putredinis TaxID=1442378 RepID=A0A9P1H9C9_9PEZI|nr:unnamed protein product [Parascedosporium putredinis]CAI8000765.1 unnamed protein product [Parascedosporium putredinis]